MNDQGQRPNAREGPEAEERPESGLGKRVALSVALGILVYAALAVWTDLEGLSKSMGAIPLWAPLAACALSFTNYVVRFPRWQRYLTLVGSEVRGWESFRIYLAGLSLTVSPGKVGEAMKSWLLRDVDGTPLARSTPIVLAERVTDLFGFIVLIAISAGTTKHLGIAIFTAALAAAIVVVAATEIGARLALGIAAKLPVLRTRVDRLEETLTSARALLSPRELPLASTLAAIGWGLECLGCWILVQSVLPSGIVEAHGLGLVEVTYAFALSSVAGAVVVITPAGLGVTEGLLSELLRSGYQSAGFAAQAARSTALSVTLVTRLCTLWFAMGIGLIALFWQHRYRRSLRGQ